MSTRISDHRQTETACGYASPEYAASFGNRASILHLPASGGHLLVRNIGDTQHSDAVSCYPVFSCIRPAALHDDLSALPEGLVSITLVTDPLLAFDYGRLETQFPVSKRLADHFITELDRGGCEPGRHHRRKLRQAAAARMEIRLEDRPSAFLENWLTLYDSLVRKAGISDTRRFSREIFAAMLNTNGTVIISAWEGETLLGADWYFQDADRVYAHLSAYSDAGYAKSVSYPLMDTAIRHFASCARILDLGGIPTLAQAGANSGLAHFKAGWSTGTLPVRLWGKVAIPAVYAELSNGSAALAEDYFPYYRRDEYGRG